jgi:hypothetical protein
LDFEQGLHDRDGEKSKRLITNQVVRATYNVSPQEKLGQENERPGVPWTFEQGLHDGEKSKRLIAKIKSLGRRATSYPRKDDEENFELELELEPFKFELSQAVTKLSDKTVTMTVTVTWPGRGARPST